jgi:hypothetical protein
MSLCAYKAASYPTSIPVSHKLQDLSWHEENRSLLGDSGLLEVLGGFITVGFGETVSSVAILVLQICFGICANLATQLGRQASKLFF